MPNANTNVQFPLTFERKQIFPNISHVTIKRSASIHLFNRLGFVCCASAKVELGLQQFNKKK